MLFSDMIEEFEKVGLGCPTYNIKEHQTLKKSLMELDHEKVVDALLKYSFSYHEIEKYIDGMTKLPKENRASFKRSLRDLKRNHHKLLKSEKRKHNFYVRICSLLERLKASVEIPLDGLELLVLFFESEKYIIERIADGYYKRHFIEFFRVSLTKYFIYYAIKCSDQKKIFDLLVRLSEKDDYYTRIPIYDHAHEFLNPKYTRLLIGEFNSRINKLENELARRRFKKYIGALVWKDENLW